MKKKIIGLLLCSIIPLSACSIKVKEHKTVVNSIINGGFESGDLSGWTIEKGNAYEDDSVSSSSDFYFDSDPNHALINNNKTGHWYLSGKGFDNSFSPYRTGSIRSDNFTLTGNGHISFKLAGGATTVGKGSADFKRNENICYLGVYRVKDNLLVARQTNTYFIEHTEDYVPAQKYIDGVYFTDNFYEYDLDLSKYMNEELYIRIVDNDTSYYYGYLSVDDIRIGGEESQTPGTYYVKDRYYETIAEAPSIYEIANGGFESGSLAGWTILEGQAFSNNGVNHEEVWWFENISYCRDGNYHYGYYKPEATGKMRSTSFILGGSGYISFKLGGCKRNNLTYLSIKLETSTGDIEVARFSNDRYWDFQFPYVANGMRLLNMNQYVADLSKYLGQKLYFEVVDLDDTPEDLGCITLDSIETYYVEKPTFTNVDHFKANTLIYPDIEIESEYQVKNGTFETGDLTGWTLNGGIGEVTSDDVWWEVNSFNKKGTYLFNGLPFENKKGSLKSSSFTVGGTGKISFLMGGGRDPRLCYVSIKDTNTNEEYARFANTFFHDIGGELINKGSNLANMNQYVADISNLLGKDVYIEVVDNATNDWGLITVDSFITYYENELSLPTKYYEARNILPKAPLGQDNDYQVTNGDFETGDLTGWTVTNGQKILDIAFSEVWWNEWYDFNKGKEYFLSGWAAGEDKTGTLTSQAFTVGGIGKMTFKLGGGKNNTLSYIEIIDADTSEVLRRYANYKFNDVNPSPHYYSGKIIDLSLEGIYEANMVDYVADLSSLMGKEVKIRIVDQAINDWGLLFVDEFITYYTSEEQLPQCLPAINTL